MAATNERWDYTILIVEDDAFNQELASAIFEEHEAITVVKASNGIEALKTLQQVSVDIVLLDLMMPEMDGFETLRRLREDGAYNDLPVIIITSEENQRRTTHKLGANDFISKPYNPIDLKQRVLNNLQIQNFSRLLEDVMDSIQKDQMDSMQYVSKLQQMIALAEVSDKRLLYKLGALAHGREEGVKGAERLGEYALLLGNMYGLNRYEAGDMSYSMSLYDIGLLGLSDHGNIHQEAFRHHIELGEEILKYDNESSLVTMAQTVSKYHHEHWDGSGYPDGLQGEDIPIYARMAALVDYFDELTACRNYDKDFMTAPDALKVIVRDSGKKLDPSLVEIFRENFSKFTEIQAKFSK